jgi:hypothetical protein
MHWPQRGPVPGLADVFYRQHSDNRSFQARFVGSVQNRHVQSVLGQGSFPFIEPNFLELMEKFGENPGDKKFVSADLEEDLWVLKKVIDSAQICSPEGNLC